MGILDAPAPLYPTTARIPLPCGTRAAAPHYPASYTIPGLSNGTSTSATYRRGHVATATATSIQIGYANIYNNNGQEASGLNDITITASIELADGTLIPLSFSGSTSKVIQPGATVFSDPVGLRLTKGTTFYTRSYVSVTAGGKWPTGLFGYHTQGDYSNRTLAQSASIGSDMTQSGTFSTQSDESVWAPVAIVGVTAASASRVIGCVGDSIMAGFLDVGIDDGWFLRTLAGNYRYQQVALSSAKLDDWFTPSRNWRRAALLAPCTDIVVALGTNNAGGLITTNQPNMQKIYDDFYAQGKRVWAVTLPPVTTSTDSWATTGNQTVSGNETNRLGMNNFIRSIPSHVFGIIDLADTLETSRNSGIWQATGVAFGYTKDGTHPTAGGAAAAATALSASALFGPAAV